MTDPPVVARLRAAGCVWAEDEAVALEEAAATPDELEALVARRVAGEPLETVLGWVEFLGRRLVVASGVFVPRRRTELLARLALTQVADRRHPDERPRWWSRCAAGSHRSPPASAGTGRRCTPPT